jgi:hypothetical protein
LIAFMVRAVGTLTYSLMLAVTSWATARKILAADD